MDLNDPLILPINSYIFYPNIKLNYLIHYTTVRKYYVDRNYMVILIFN